MKRSGTNYVAAMCALNFRDVVVFSNILGWKHGPIAPPTYDGSNWFETDRQRRLHERAYLDKLQPVLTHAQQAVASGQLRVIVVIRNPYAGYLSFARRWHGWRPEAKDYPHARAVPYARSWSRSNRQWLEAIAERPCSACVVYEEFVSDIRAGLHALGGRLSLRTREPLVDVADDMPMGADYLRPLDLRTVPATDRRADAASRLASYRAVVESIPGEVVDRMNACLDTDLMRRFRYPLLRPSTRAGSTGPASSP